ncbi:MAG: TIGR03960 family B12-binding radical SAM protein [Desulfobacterales bacterium]|nr:TIGR03960 family B12-binding radical SAM protein [Desulfobacterales bacterium]
MANTNIQDLLPFVERPSRYLGSEINRIRKDFHEVKLKIALAFPELYEIGVSHFGLSILYHILNGRREIAAERVYAPGIDLENHMRKSGLSLESLESRLPLRQFDIIGFSLLYELNYTNVLQMLDLARIPFHAAARDRSYPLVIAGGPCTCNPEPVAAFFDALVIGDGEQVVLQMADVWLGLKDQGPVDKEALLLRWSRIPGVYIPAFFNARFDAGGHPTLLPVFSHHRTVTRAIVEDLDRSPFPRAPIVPFSNPVHDRLRLEISRGCTRGCRFCQAGMIYRPVRERSVATLLELADQGLLHTGYEDLSLLSLSTSDYAGLVRLMEQLLLRCSSRVVAVSLPSFRAGTLSAEIMKMIQKVRKTGFTIAPEAGSQRLRDVINKNISEKDVFDTVRSAFDLGWQVMKLYFMVGLPTETDEDIDAIIRLVKSLRQIKSPHGRRGKINVSLTCFIPKPHTPFQWAAQISPAQALVKVRKIQNGLRLSGIDVKFQDPKVSLIEGLLARGDRRFSRLLLAAYQKGCKFDGWSDHFHFGKWQEAIDETGLDVNRHVLRERDVTEALAWDHIVTRVKHDFFVHELHKSLGGEKTGDCRTEACNDCGVCDFTLIRTRVFDPGQAAEPAPAGEEERRSKVDETFKITYAKTGPARYFGHLELVRIFSRAIRRAGIPVKFSEGFHPKPKISFEDPLPIGIESLCEAFYFSVSDICSPQSIAARLNLHLPAGLEVRDCLRAARKKGEAGPGGAVFEISLKAGFFNENELKSFADSDRVVLSRQNRKGTVQQIELKQLVLKIDLLAGNRLELTLRAGPAETVRPLEIVREIFTLPEEDLKQARVLKLKNV